MASIEDRNGSVRVIVSCGRDIYGKKIRESATFVPDPELTPKKRQKAIEEFARQFEAQVKNARRTRTGNTDALHRGCPSIAC